jgi:hypothetical protein
MAIELSTLTFTEQDDIVPQSGVEQIFNTGVANTLAGNDRITGTGSDYGFKNLGVLNTDDGNDTITGMDEFFFNNPPNFGIYNSGTLNTGEGNDIITGFAFYDGLTNYGTINTGEGNDTIIGSGRGTGIFSSEGSIFDTGDGNDLIRANNRAGIDNSSNAFTTGDGNDTIDAGGGDSPPIYNQGLINMGNGEDYIISGVLFNYGGVFLGNGNDSISVDAGYSEYILENFNFIGTGDGNDTITCTSVIYNHGVIETGNGDDSIIVDGGVDGTGFGYDIDNNGGAINMGDGNDSIIANEGFKSGSNSSGAWFLGEGDDYIKGYGSGDFYGGNGNDTLELTPGTYTVGIWGEAGESPIFTKGDQLMITSEFEKLKAGRTIYDFTSLTAGQIIVVA